MTQRSAFENPQIADMSLSGRELQNLLSLQRRMLREALTRNDYRELLDELCLLAESFTPNAVVTIMLYDQRRNALFVENAPSLTVDAITDFNGLRSGDGSCGNAVYHNEVMYVCNTLHDARWTDVAELAERYEICSCFAFPIPDANGEAIGSFAISSFEPRTPESFHQALLETCASICSVILQRRADEELRQKMIEEQIRAERVESLGVLAGGIAHDFNNLLTAIMGNVDLAAYAVTDDAAKEPLRLAEKAIRRAAELTRQLMTISKGNSPVKSASDIGEIIRESAEFGLLGSSVSCRLTGLNALQHPMIYVDKGQIGQLVHNLVINARQAMPDGGVVRIECTEVDGEDHPSLTSGNYLRLTVSDEGVGMSAEVLEHLFVPYFTTRDTGSGLGLFLCYSIVKNHGGIITVDSEQGIGTRITIYLPHLFPPAAPSVEVDDCQSPKDLNANILVMDDDALIRRTLKQILQRLGCRVWEAADGASAIHQFEDLRSSGEHVDALILDLTIPGGMGGLETRDELKKRDPKCRLIVSSGYSTGDACIDYEAAGFDAAVMKPYGIDTLRRVLQEVLPNTK